eukprot:CAMPEP_0169187268 /NCGR_PEP_ID=MMETSP1016-20121227/2828_1 /TAXON_ID=342587 /ORGANISM="Karlodinium micrum, Strain CCMP2283" /LENGTH=49 /DNA_ID=CAMNT_0009263205 /DNA_START=252 /DNA_END=401 /DNA_ORIENTATION=+
MDGRSSLCHANGACVLNWSCRNLAKVLPWIAIARGLWRLHLQSIVAWWR